LFFEEKYSLEQICVNKYIGLNTSFPPGVPYILAFFASLRGKVWSFNHTPTRPDVDNVIHCTVKNQHRKNSLGRKL